jgi:hypothetical protein
MLNYNYTIKNNNINKFLGNNSIVTTTISNGSIQAEGIILPYTGNPTNKVTISNVFSSYQMNSLISNKTISFGNNNDVVSNINTYGNIIPAFDNVAKNINNIPPAIITNISVTDANFNMVNMNVIIFNRIGQDVIITYPDDWIHTFENTYHYIWYFENVCENQTHRIKLIRFDKEVCQ